MASSVSNLFAAIDNACCPIYLQPPTMSASLPSQAPAETMGSRGYCNGANMRGACHCLKWLLLPKLAVTLNIMHRNACRVKQGLQCQGLQTSVGIAASLNIFPLTILLIIRQSFCQSWLCVVLSQHPCSHPALLFPSLPISANSCSS